MSAPSKEEIEGLIHKLKTKWLKDNGYYEIYRENEKEKDNNIIR